MVYKLSIFIPFFMKPIKLVKLYLLERFIQMSEAIAWWPIRHWKHLHDYSRKEHIPVGCALFIICSARHKSYTGGQLFLFGCFVSCSVCRSCDSVSSAFHKFISFTTVTRNRYSCYGCRFVILTVTLKDVLFTMASVITFVVNTLAMPLYSFDIPWCTIVYIFICRINYPCYIFYFRDDEI